MCYAPNPDGSEKTTRDVESDLMLREREKGIQDWTPEKN